MEGILLDGADQALGDQRDAPRSTLIHAGISVPHTAGYASAHLVSDRSREPLVRVYSANILKPSARVRHIFLSVLARLCGDERRLARLPAAI